VWPAGGGPTIKDRARDHYRTILYDHLIETLATCDFCSAVSLV
jgi:hypothetical protein